MASRGNESPMDFEWQGHGTRPGTGPIDPNSPFTRVIQEKQRKRTHTEFNSPPKGTVPTLAQPNSKPWFFSNPPLPASPFRTPSFTTPRKQAEFDFSSGPESSPIGMTENEETPDGKPLPPLPIEFASKPTDKRNSLFSMYGRYAPSAQSPGRGEIMKPYSSAVTKRIYKKRRKAQNFERQIATERRSSEDTSDDDAGSDEVKYKNSKEKAQEIGWMTGIFQFIHTYPDAPSIIAKYLQVFFNAVILTGCLYLLYSFYTTIQGDVDRASHEAEAEVLAEMAACSRNYIENHCGADRRLPALETVCSNWELCMNKDPKAVPRATLSAHTFAEIFNSFVESISLKTMIFTFALVALSLFINNATFSSFRKSQELHNMEAYRQASGGFAYPPFPQTPGLPYTPQHGGWQNHQVPNQHLEYQRSPSKEQGRSRSRSPEKKRLMM